MICLANDFFIQLAWSIGFFTLARYKSQKANDLSRYLSGFLPKKRGTQSQKLERSDIIGNETRYDDAMVNIYIQVERLYKGASGVDQK